jgi:hypothetical protein
MRLENVTARTIALLGAAAILVALALVPVGWHCSGAIRGWNFVIFALVAGGGSAIGSAASRWARRRVVGIFVTVVVVLAALFAVGGLATLGCD